MNSRQSCHISSLSSFLNGNLLPARLLHKGRTETTLERCCTNVQVPDGFIDVSFLEENFQAFSNEKKAGRRVGRDPGPCWSQGTRSSCRRNQNLHPTCPAKANLASRYEHHVTYAAMEQFQSLSLSLPYGDSNPRHLHPPTPPPPSPYSTPPQSAYTTQNDISKERHTIQQVAMSIRAFYREYTYIGLQA